MNNNNNENKEFRAGLVALVGLPNVGKSTLLNALIGEKVSIVSAKPQTTRNAIYGIKTEENYQAIFVDTPGFHSPKSRLNKAIVQQIVDSLAIVDVICVLAEAGHRQGKDFERLLEMINKTEQPKVLVVTKIDNTKRELVYKTAEELFPLCKFNHVLPISAKKDVNIEDLMKVVASELPENIMQYDEDLITTQPERFLVAEYIREQLFIYLHQEVPYDTLVEIQEFEDTAKKINISAVIYVNRDSQKGIVIGDGGSMMKRIGEGARKNIESFFDKKVYLEMWVKVKEGWVGKQDYLDIQGLK